MLLLFIVYVLVNNVGKEYLKVVLVHKEKVVVFKKCLHFVSIESSVCCIHGSYCFQT